MNFKNAKKHDFCQSHQLSVCELYLYKMLKGQLQKLQIFTFFILIVLMLPLTPVLGQRSIGLDKNGKVKRIHFYEKSRIKVKLVDKEHVSGRIDAIYDSSFVVDGRKILLNEVSTVYSTRPVMRFMGGALMVSGAFYFGIDAVNNLLNYEARGYVFSNSVWAPAAIAVGTGAVLYYFSTRRTKVYEKGNFRIFNTTLIPVKHNSVPSDSVAYCPESVEAVVTKMNLDGCNWVLLLPNGDKLEPLNIFDYLTEGHKKDEKPFKVKLTYSNVESASICMIGQTVVINCWEVIKPIQNVNE
jgi:hypothetical protein